MTRAPIAADEHGAAAIEMAFALPVLIVMIWAFVQLAQVYRAMAGIQQALGQGARYATLCIPGVSGCSAPSPGSGPSPASDSVKAKIQNSVYGIGPGTFTVDDPSVGTSGTGSYYDLTVCYQQPTNLLLFPGPTIKVSRSKRVWIASTNVTASTAASSCAS
ncbi:MAG TPA: TadE family protein [Sphingomicrobium sp.]|nr:TadE family protein [Sphingomicrobium sp.]